MKSTIAILAILGMAPLSWAQDGWTETRFHRVHLHNGNFIDGALISDKPGEVIILIKGGEMAIRRDQIEKVELVKTRSRNDAPIILKTPDKTDTATTSKGMEDRTQAKTDTPEAIKKKVDMILFKYKNAPGQEKNIPWEEVGALGEEGTVYLASRAPAFDLKSMDGIAAALINLNKIKVSDKVNAVLEGYLAHENPSVRAFSVSVLSDQGEAAKTKYLRPMLTDKDVRVKVTVLASLGSVEERAWYEPVADLCSDPDKDVRTRAYRLARNLATKHDLNQHFSGIMVGNLRNDNAEIRSESADMLGVLGIKETWKGLAEALSDPEAKVRASAAQSLLKMQLPESGEETVSAMGRERDKFTRISLAGLATKLKLTKSIEILISWLGDADEDIKRTSHVALQGITNQAFPLDAAAWDAWWQANKPK